MAKALITLGIVLLTIGLLWPWFSKLNWGKLPGDIVLERGSFEFYAPVTTSIILSILLSMIVWLLQKL